MQSHDMLDRFNDRLWRLAQHALHDHATFVPDEYSFTLNTNPFPDEIIHPGPCRMGKNGEEANTFRVGHPLAQRIIEHARAQLLPCAQLTCDYSGSGKKRTVVEPLVGRAGWLRCERLAVNSIEPEDHLLVSARLDDGRVLDETECRRLLELPAVVDDHAGPSADVVDGLDLARDGGERSILEELATRNGRWFDSEMEKLDRWAEDRRTTLKRELAELDEKIREARKTARFAPSLPEKLERQRDLKRLETRRDDSWREFDKASREVDSRKDELLDEVARQMRTYVERLELFTVRFLVV